jgi:hypothetical protein
MITYFATRKIAEIAAGRAARAECAAEAARLAAHNVYTIEPMLERAVTHARAEERTFELRLHESMPPHVVRALEQEIELWERLQHSLKDFWQAEPSSADLDAYTANVLQYLSYQRDFLYAEEEMLTSCLVQHYETTMLALRDAASRVPL